MVAREGEHCVWATCACSKRVPVAANASKCGVKLGSVLLYAPCDSARSVSGKNKIMLGRVSFGALLAKVTVKRMKKKRVVGVTFFI